ncbi:MAG: exodeoxyribonuclease VII small subunit [Natronomonas sp.]
MSNDEADADAEPAPDVEAGPDVDPGAIEARVDRVETIIERLETEDLPLADATRLRTEAEQLLAELDSTLDLGEGSVVERDT